MTFFYFLIYIAVLLAAAGQIMLKLGAGAGGLDLGILRLNLWVIMGLGAMILSMLLNVRGLSVVPLRDMAFIAPTIYIVLPLFSRIFLKEKLRSRVIVGTLILILGVVLFNIPIMRIF